MTSTEPHASPKAKGKFGMFMGSVGKSAKKGFSRATKQMEKGVVKAKIMAVEKIAKAEPTPEEPEIISALEKLKVTKNEIYQLSDVVRNLYDARVNETTYLFQLAERMANVHVSVNGDKSDAFGSYVKKMGESLQELEKVANIHLNKMNEEFVLPLEKFRDNDIEQVQKFKLKYKNGKSEYDLAQHRVERATESGDTAKIAGATQKRDAALAELTELRKKFSFDVANLEQKKQVALLGSLEQYWHSYSSFAAAQANILSKALDVDKFEPVAAANMNQNAEPGLVDYSDMSQGLPSQNQEQEQEQDQNQNSNQYVADFGYQDPQQTQQHQPQQVDYNGIDYDNIDYNADNNVPPPAFNDNMQNADADADDDYVQERYGDDDADAGDNPNNDAEYNPFAS